MDRYDEHRRNTGAAWDEAGARAGVARGRVAEIAERLGQLRGGDRLDRMLASDAARHERAAKSCAWEAHARSRRSHERAARAHELAAAQHDRAAAVYADRGFTASAAHERAAGIRERQAADKDRATACTVPLL